MVGFITSLRFPVMGVNYMTNYVIAIDQQKNDCFGMHWIRAISYQKKKRKKIRAIMWEYIKVYVSYI